MFSSDSLSGAVAVLKLGVIGLGFILAFMAFALLYREQRKPEPHSVVLRAIYIFMGFSLVLSGFGLYAQLGSDRSGHEFEILQREKDRLDASMAQTLQALADKDELIAGLETETDALQNELSRVKTSSVNWDYTPNGDRFRCKVNGRSVGVLLDCRNHGTCNNRELNRAICALRYGDQVWQ